MKSTIKLISGAAILLASPVRRAIAQETIKVGMSGKYFPFTFVKQDKLQGLRGWTCGTRSVSAPAAGRVRDRQLLRPVRHAGNRPRRHHLQQITITDERKASTPSPSPMSMTVPRSWSQGQQHHPRHRTWKAEGRRQPGLQLRRAAAQNDPNKKIDIRTYDSAFEQGMSPWARIDAFVMDRVSTAQLIKESSCRCNRLGTVRNHRERPALPEDPGKRAVLKKVDDALTAMRKDGTLTKISEKWFASGHHQQINDGI